MTYHILTSAGLIEARIILEPEHADAYAATLTDGRTLRPETPENQRDPWVPQPPPHVPTEVTRRQLFLALLAVNPSLTRSAIRDMITTEAGLIEFDEALAFRRDHPLTSQLAAAVGLTSEQVDDLFRQAATL